MKQAVFLHPGQSSPLEKNREYSPLADCRLEAVLCHGIPCNTVEGLDNQKALLEPGLALLHGPSNRIFVKCSDLQGPSDRNCAKSADLHGPSTCYSVNVQRGPSTRTCESGL